MIRLLPTFVLYTLAVALMIGGVLMNRLQPDYGSALAMGFTVEDVQNWPGAVEAVTVEQVRDVARRFLVPERSVTGYLRREAAGG